MIIATKHLFVFLLALPLAMAGQQENYSKAAGKCAKMGGTVLRCNTEIGDSIGTKQTTKIHFQKIAVRGLLKCEGKEVNAFACVWPFPDDKEVVGFSVFDLEGEGAEYFGVDEKNGNFKDSLCWSSYNLIGTQTSLRTICKGVEKGNRDFKIVQELKIIKK